MGGRGAGDGALSGTIKVLIVDDDALVRAGLAMILSGADDIAVVGEAADGSGVPAAVAAHGPDVVLMDIRMPRVDGLAATEALRSRAHAPEIIVLTTFDADEFVLRALRAGASGFLLKDTPPREILHAVRKVAAGEAILSPTVTRRLIAHVAAPVGPNAPAADRTPGRREALARLGVLSERERDVALAVAQGKSNAEVSADLYMSVATVKAHVSRLLVKLDLNNRVQIALLVHDAGLA
ncbi:response regulator transcription factor [Actinoplanes sp. TFC3]|uniref:response regulator transcription factor n=1 Tax=Actinoplanes sp. TFC3 TaxID=1710355 RepID=UPI0009EB3974|nr:response regulator transcription factor [Actinoplanes sp. TFC3]